MHELDLKQFSLNMSTWSLGMRALGCNRQWQTQNAVQSCAVQSSAFPETRVEHLKQSHDELLHRLGPAKTLKYASGHGYYHATL